MRRLPLAQIEQWCIWHVGANCVRPQTLPLARCCREANGMTRVERMNIECGRVDSRIDPYINLPLSGEVPRRGRGGTEAAFGTVSNNNALTNFTSSVSPATIQLPLQGEAFGCIPCPYTVCRPCVFTAFRREQAPALRYEVGLCALGEAISLPQTLPLARYCRGSLWAYTVSSHSL